MREVLPVLLGFCLGGLSTRLTGHPLRAAFGSGIVGCIALAAVFTSGEFRLSWTYALLDLLEAAAGFVAGSAVVWRHRIAVVQK
jgi:hypothetical protein